MSEKEKNLQNKKYENFQTVLPVLDGGVFQRKLGLELAETALAVVVDETASNTGKVIIELDLKRIGDSSQVVLSHKIKSTKPTARGKRTEEDTTETPLFVNFGGVLSLTPEKSVNGQTEMGFSLKEERK
ncbi:hypothetical protein vBVpP1_69 [Vibrio phage vB_VpP_1]|nr:hypothetical protein vBVpP1_69 [Vibrio phage vB_VpP_1]